MKQKIVCLFVLAAMLTVASCMDAATLPFTDDFSSGMGNWDPYSNTSTWDLDPTKWYVNSDGQLNASATQNSRVLVKDLILDDFVMTFTTKNLWNGVGFTFHNDMSQNAYWQPEVDYYSGAPGLRTVWGNQGRGAVGGTTNIYNAGLYNNTISWTVSCINDILDVTISTQGISDSLHADLTTIPEFANNLGAGRIGFWTWSQGPSGGGGYDNVVINVPEPGSLAFLAMGLVGLVGLRRKSRL